MLVVHLGSEFTPTEGALSLDLEKGLLAQLWEMVETQMSFEDICQEHLVSGVKKDYEMKKVSEVFSVTSLKFFKDVMAGDPVFLYKKPTLRSFGKVLNKFKTLYYYGYFAKRSVAFDVYFKDLSGVPMFGQFVSDLMGLQEWGWPVKVNVVFDEKELLYTAFLSHLKYEVAGSLVKPKLPDMSKLKQPTPADLESLKSLLGKED